MATFQHPETDVTLNLVPVQRSNLSITERETARLLRRAGYKQQHIAAMLGTNQGRVNEALEDDDDAPPINGRQASLF